MYALVDCNNFYVSCERVFAPKLRGRPVVVLSNNDGCVISRSQEAKDLGIPMGAAIFEWKTFIRRNNVAVHSSNYPLYGDMSHRVMATLELFSANIEIYSIDEAFIDLRHVSTSKLEDIAHEIRRTVFRWTGMPVSVGVAPTKTLTKLANRAAKRDKDSGGVMVLEPGDALDSLLETYPAGGLWGIGSQHARFLEANGVRTARDLRDAPADWVRKHLTVCGLRTQYELQGTPCIPLEEAPPAKQGIGCSRSFGKMIEGLPELSEALATYTTRSAEKLRGQQSAAGIVHVYLLTNRFRKDLPQYSNALTKRLPIASCYTPELIDAALDCLRRIYKPGYHYKKVGVLLMDIVPHDAVQLDLFHSDYPFEQRAQVMEAMDEVNARWGSHTVTCAAAGFRKPWRMRQQRLSPRYTTAWSELMRVSLPKNKERKKGYTNSSCSGKGVMQSGDS